MGKILPEGLGDVQEAIDMGYYMAGEGRRLSGETVPSELPNKDMKSIRVPIGVFGLITPWNFPIAIPGWKIFPALICGNTVVFKPSSRWDQTFWLREEGGRWSGGALDTYSRWKVIYRDFSGKLQRAQIDK